jgi:hypothetical protein
MPRSEFVGAMTAGRINAAVQSSYSQIVDDSKASQALAKLGS